MKPVDGWYQAPFGKLQALPKDAKPISSWSNEDEAYTNIAAGIRKVAENMSKNLKTTSNEPAPKTESGSSKNRRVQRRIDELESQLDLISKRIVLLEKTEVTETRVEEKLRLQSLIEEDKKKRNFGVVMGILAAITETMIFIFVKSNTDAKASPYYTVNHLYPAGLAMLAAYGIFHKNIVDTSGLNWTKLLGFNALLGFTGYIARFYAIPKIPTIVFSLLSFFGVTFGYLWGIIFMGDKPTMKALIGGGLIAGSTAILRYFGSV